MSAVFSIYLKYDPSLATVNSWIGAANLMKKKQKTAAILISITLIPSAKYIIPITRKRMSQLSIQASFRKQAK